MRQPPRSPAAGEYCRRPRYLYLKRNTFDHAVVLLPLIMGSSRPARRLGGLGAVVRLRSVFQEQTSGRSRPPFVEQLTGTFRLSALPRKGSRSATLCCATCNGRDGARSPFPTAQQAVAFIATSIAKTDPQNRRTSVGNRKAEALPNSRLQERNLIL